MPPTEADRQAVARLAAERCGRCRGSEQRLSDNWAPDSTNVHDPCPDCLQDGKPTGAAHPGLVRECPQKYSIDYCKGSDCVTCQGSGVVPVSPEAALWWLEQELEKYGDYSYSHCSEFSPQNPHEYVLLFMSEHTDRICYDANRITAAAKALAAAKEERSATT